MEPTPSPEPAARLTALDQRRLLEIAREAIEKRLSPGRPEGPPNGREGSSAEDSAVLRERRGVFVTLHRSGQLRGCIGYIQGFKPLAQAVGEMALAAAFGDPRFPPVTADELDGLDVEISVLTPLRRISDPSEIHIGEHGLYIVRGALSGLLLPQVATEYGWDRETFLQHTCLKAGLPKTAWQDPDSEIYLFAAQIFGEASG
jgi:AmmeMemoRadiSam system protein A